MLGRSLVAIFSLLLLLPFGKIQIASIEKIHQLPLNIWFGFNEIWQLATEGRQPYCHVRGLANYILIRV